MDAAATTIQDANVAALEAITTNGGKVEAYAVNGPATESCANDSAHGKGVCYDSDGDGLCLACEIAAIEARILCGMLISVEVYA